MPCSRATVAGARDENENGDPAATRVLNPQYKPTILGNRIKPAVGQGIGGLDVLPGTLILKDEGQRIYYAASIGAAAGAVRGDMAETGHLVEALS